VILLINRVKRKKITKNKISIERKIFAVTGRMEAMMDYKKAGVDIEAGYRSGRN